MKKNLILSLLALSFFSLRLSAQTDIKSDKDKSAANKTVDNLKRAINSEEQSFEYYDASAAKAKKDGYPNIAEEFSVIAAQEKLHYARFKDVLNKMNVTFKETKPNYVLLSTKDNVKASYNLEEVAINVYERAIEEAKSNGYKDAAEAFKWALDMEKIHASIFKNFMDNFDSFKMSK